MKTPLRNSLRFTFILCLAHMLMPKQNLAQAQMYPDYVVSSNPGGGLTITKYIGPGGNVIIPSNPLFRVTGIGSGAFADCTNLTSVSIPAGVSWIGLGAFSGCTGLTNISIPGSVSLIDLFAFSRCTSLPRITIPSGVSSIMGGALDGCSGLTSITVDSQNSAYSSLDGVLFNKNRTTLIHYPAAKTGGYIIPEGVTGILYGWPLYGSAFSGCTGLTSITIPSSVTNIGDYTFMSCSSLTGAYLSGNAPAPGTSIFEGANNVTVYYLPGTTGWGTTFGDRPTAPWVLSHPVILNNGPSFGVQKSGFGFIMSWATNGAVVVEASTSLANPSWSPVGTNTLIDGSSYFSDPQWTNHPSRFYRLRSP